MQFWTPLEHPAAGFYEAEGSSIYRAMHAGRKVNHDRRFKEFLARNRNVKGVRFLDVGCSDGLMMETLRRLGGDVMGFDIDSIAAARARERGLQHVFCEDFSAFIDRARREKWDFDVILMFDVLEHLVDPVTVLQQLGTLLRSGGALVGTVPNRDRFLANEVSTDFPPHHFFRFSHLSLGSLFRRLGYSMEDLRTFEYGYTHKIMLNSVLKRIRRAARTAPAPHGAPSRGTTSTWRRALVSAVHGLGAPFASIVERSAGKGFKLYFSIRRAAV